MENTHPAPPHPTFAYSLHHHHLPEPFYLPRHLCLMMVVVVVVVDGGETWTLGAEPTRGA